MAIITEYQCDACGKRSKMTADMCKVTTCQSAHMPDVNWYLCRTCAGQVREVIRLIKKHGSVTVTARVVTT